MISTSPKKEKEAINTLGADHFVVSKDEAQMSVRPSRCADTYRLLLLSGNMALMPFLRPWIVTVSICMIVCALGHLQPRYVWVEDPSVWFEGVAPSCKALSMLG